MTEDGSRLIVGLGNPGEKYRFTRHNIGFMVVDRLAHVHQISLDKRKCNVVFGRGRAGHLAIILAKPMTFMNRSGQAAKELACFFGLGKEDLLVIHDDIDFDFGKIKIKQKGGDGGHNGIKSLIEAWGSGAFTRVRIGIGRPQTQEEVRAYVLGRFGAKEEKFLEEVIATAQDAVETISLKGISEAMNRLHGKIIPIPKS